MVEKKIQFLENLGLLERIKKIPIIGDFVHKLVTENRDKAKDALKWKIRKILEFINNGIDRFFPNVGK